MRRGGLAGWAGGVALEVARLFGRRAVGAEHREPAGGDPARRPLAERDRVRARVARADELREHRLDDVVAKVEARADRHGVHGDRSTGRGVGRKREAGTAARGCVPPSRDRVAVSREPPEDAAEKAALIRAAGTPSGPEAGASPPAATAPAKKKRRIPSPPVDYLERTRHAPINMLFLAPWVLVYLLCWLWAGPRVETSAAASVRTGLRLLGERGMFALTLCGTLAVCAVLLARVRTAKRDAAVFPWMLVEGIVYGLLLHLVADGFSRVAPVGRWLGLARWAKGAEAVQALGIAAGAGIFEGLVFRGCLAPAADRARRDIVGP